MARKKILNVLWAYFALTIGCVIFCLAWTQVFIPNGLVSGGVTGLCTVLQYGTGIPVPVSYGIINAALLILAFVALGRSFGFRTIFSLAAITILLEVLPMLDLPPLILKDRILIPIIASLCEAIGISILINYGGSSGGTDIVAMVINKFWSVSMGHVYMVSDIAIIGSMLLIPGKTVDDVIYGYMAVIVFSFSIDYIMMGRKSSVQVFIFSERYAEIADYINKKMDRGVTALKALGWYSQKDKNVLLILVRRTELNELTNKVKELDSKAFVAITPVTSVFGEGFEEIKSGFKRKRKTIEK